MYRYDINNNLCLLTQPVQEYWTGDVYPCNKKQNQDCLSSELMKAKKTGNVAWNPHL